MCFNFFYSVYNVFHLQIPIKLNCIKSNCLLLAGSKQKLLTFDDICTHVTYGFKFIIGVSYLVPSLFIINESIVCKLGFILSQLIYKKNRKLSEVHHMIFIVKCSEFHMNWRTFHWYKVTISMFCHCYNCHCYNYNSVSSLYLRQWINEETVHIFKEWAHRMLSGTSLTSRDSDAISAKASRQSFILKEKLLY